MRPTRLHLRCTDAELDAWRHAAERDGRTLSDWIRRQLNGRRRAAADRDSEHERVAVTLDHPAIHRASALAIEHGRFRPDPKHSHRGAR